MKLNRILENIHITPEVFSFPGDLVLLFSLGCLKQQDMEPEDLKTPHNTHAGTL